MRVFASAAFRYPPQTGLDYPYGFQDFDDAFALTLINAGMVTDATKPGGGTGASNFGQLAGNPRDNIALGAALDAAAASGGTPSTATPAAATTAGAVGTATAFARGDHAHPAQTPASMNALSIAQAWDPVANNPHLASGTPPTGNNTYYDSTSVGTTTTLGAAIDGYTQSHGGDLWVFDGINSVWKVTRQCDLGLRAAGIVKNQAADGQPLLAIPDIDYKSPPVLISGVTILTPIQGTVGTNGAFNVGLNSPGGGTLTFSQSTAGAGVTVTESGGTAPFVAADNVGRAIQVGNVVCPITAFTSTTQVVVTIPSGGISSTTWASGSWWLGTAVTAQNGFGYYNKGAWIEIVNANAVFSGSPAGKFWSTWQNSMQATLFNNVYTPGHNAVGDASSWHVPASPTAVSGTGSTNAPSLATDYIAYQTPYVGGSTGPNGEIEEKIRHRNNSSSSIKKVYSKLDTLTYGYSNSQTTNTQNADIASIQNKGIANGDIIAPPSDVTHAAGGFNGSAFDLSSNHTLTIAQQVNLASDWSAVESFRLTTTYGA